MMQVWILVLLFVAPSSHAVIKALTTASTGLEAQQANIERISNDLSNVNTDGYKRARIEFNDLMYETIREPGQATGVSSQTPTGVQIGRGVRIGSTHKIFEQGPMRMTYNSYDLMIQGTGFFPIRLPDGTIAYTRTGAFHRDATGRVVNNSGAVLIPEIVVPSNTINIIIKPNGEITVALPDAGEAVIGNLQLVRFVNPQGLKAVGNNTYIVSNASGQPLQGIPGEDGFGVIQQGALEGSNVNVANSMVEMITTQRAYEMGTKVMGVADKMLEATVNLK